MSANRLCIIDNSLDDIFRNKNINNFVVFSDFDKDSAECKSFSGYDVKMYNYDISFLKTFTEIIKNIEAIKFTEYSKTNNYLISPELMKIIYNYTEDDYLYIMFHYCKYDNQIIRHRLIQNFLNYKKSLRKIMSIVIIQENILIPYDLINNWNDGKLSDSNIL